MFKKAMSLLLSVMLVVASLSVTLISASAAEGEPTAVYVTGSPAGVFGVEWGNELAKAEANNNVMTANDDGTYSITYTVEPTDSILFQVVEYYDAENVVWHGVSGVGTNNFYYKSAEGGELTITFNPNAEEAAMVEVIGDVEAVTTLNIENMYAVGAGDGNWINGVSWTPDAEENIMTEVSEGVYEITYTDIPYGTDYYFKFAAGSWSVNWGAGEQGFLGIDEPDDPQPYGAVTEAAAKYDGGNWQLINPYDMADITLTLDLTNFDFNTKEGAVVRVDLVEKTESQPESSEPESSEPETSEPETSEPETSEPAADQYRVAGVSALCGSNWDATDDANLMTYNESTARYEKVYTGVAAGSYDWKVTKNVTTWIPDGMGNDNRVTVEADNSTVTIWYDAVANTWDADVVAGEPAESSEPETSEPETSEPETSEPETSEPETSEPETSEPETSEPETSEPETSEPETSEPETSEPETSEPETSEPATDPSTEYKYGDVNGDGYVNVKDATLIQRISVEDAELVLDELHKKILADVNGDEDVNVKDATCILLYTVESLEGTGRANQPYEVSEPSSTETQPEPSSTDIQPSTDESSEPDETTSEETTAPVGDQYRVAGVSALCGSNWDSSDDANLMTYNESTARYEKVYTGVATGDYDWKVTKNVSTWIPDGMGNDNRVTVEADNSTVTIWYDATANTWGADVVAGEPAESSEPETSEPETSEPETSEPETSEPSSDPVDKPVFTSEQLKELGMLAGNSDNTEARDFCYAHMSEILGGTDEANTQVLYINLYYLYYGELPEGITELPGNEDTNPDEPATPVFTSVGLIGTINGVGDWNEETYEMTYADGVWSVEVTFTLQDNNFKARVNDDWEISFGAEKTETNPDGNVNEPLWGVYKISIADGAADGTLLTFEDVTTEPIAPAPAE